MQDLPRSHRRAFETIPAMITPAIIILFELPFESGMSHHAKATSGLHVVQGCGFRYWGTPHHASQRRTSISLRTGTDLYGGILTPVDIVPLHSFFFSFDILFVVLSFLCFKARRFISALEGLRVPYPLTPTSKLSIIDIYILFNF
ncbi:MAG: hypothetical protein C3F06_12610 [Candidatus Methanoperedenaceae archaeon]|nr:MAG: hypothetical protein C3F06_12610 [Candidatus Methanoperedenaceae archaeon]